MKPRKENRKKWIELTGYPVGTHFGCLPSKKRTTEYSTWLSMIARCDCRKQKKAHLYVLKGIKVCDRWRDCFLNFLSDMGKKPTGMTIERINSNGDYEPSNCKWATYRDQGSNTSRNRRITANGKTMIMADWARELGCTPKAIQCRMDLYGWKPEEAVTTPVSKKYNPWKFKTI